MDSQHATCFMSPLWQLEFSSCFLIFVRILQHLRKNELTDWAN